MRCAGGHRLMVSLAILMALAVPSSAQRPTEGIVTDADIIRMVQAAIPEELIVREIQMSDTRFVTTPNSLIELKHKGVPDSVLAAILDSKSGAKTPQAERSSSSYRAAQPASAGPHQVPTFDASVRINSTKTGKVSMGKNHLEVERAGVPMFIVTWKVKKSQ